MHKMVVVPYNPKWKAQFKLLERRLLASSDSILKVEHTGSTAIVGMLAKPIIDMIAVISEIKDFEKVKNDLAKLGYEHVGDLGIKGREAFSHQHEIAHHLYICHHSATELHRQILFRDYLNADLKARAEYRKIKEEIIATVGLNNRAEYVKLKAENYQYFFDEILAKDETSTSKKSNTE